MTLETMSRGWTAAVAAAILATVAALAIVGVSRAQSVSDLTVGSATVAPGTQGVVINVTGTVSQLGSYRVDVTYDATLVDATACSSTNGVCSIDTVAANTVRINGSNLSGISGDDVLLGTITFTAGNTEGEADLNVDTSTMVLSDTTGASLSVTPTNGSITIAQATAAPTGTATTAASASATATPGGLPATGGSFTTDSANTMVWLLAAAGLAIAAGGAWAMARARREN
jgi:hypothetical protein